MPSVRRGQSNVRSEFARVRARERAELTGNTTTRVVEHAPRSYVPPGGYGEAVAPLPRKGRIVVIPANGRAMSLDEADAALEAARMGEDGV